MNIFAKNSGITEKHKKLIILPLSIKGRERQDVASESVN